MNRTGGLFFMSKSVVLLSILLLSFVSAVSEMSVPAVDAQSQGILTHLRVTVRNGTGSVFVDTEPFISVETQNSAKVAARVATSTAGRNLSNYDFFFKIVADTQSVDGPSGGIAMTLLSYAELTGKKLRPDLTATGTIELDGSVGQVGGVVEKIGAAASQGITLFLIPLGQRVQNGVDLTQYAESKWGVQVVEVKNLKEALNYAFSQKGSKVTVPERIEPPLILVDLTSRTLPQTEPLRQLAQNQLDKLSSLRMTFSPDSVIYAVLTKSMNTTRTLLKNGYYYSAANEAFITQVQVEAFQLSNASKGNVETKIDDLQKELDSFTPGPTTDKNVEWSAGSRLRWYWAQKRLAEVREKLALADTALPVLQDYSAAALWLSAARQMDALSAKMGGSPLDEPDWKGYASDRLDIANRTLRESPLDSEAVFHLETANLAFQNGDFVTSSFDSAFVIAFSHARTQLVEQAEKSDTLVRPATVKELDDRFTAWGQLYYAHALYSVQEANRSGDFGYTVNALKLTQLASELDGNLKTLSGNPPQGRVADPLSSSSVIVTTIPAVSGPSPYLFGAVLLLVFGLLVALIFVLSRKTKSAPTLSGKEKTDLLEMRLLEGKISEKTYEKLSKKFEGPPQRGVRPMSSKKKIR